ncbi:hypothetical protein [Acinetobacter ihumii]|uniref:hypothetical protein n=1 Tax=Acinetobacter ihumii TaxID=2483802 RepID=UPI0010323838|nr:hypothetical protein [Acinetobacter ihumii]
MIKLKFLSAPPSTAYNRLCIVMILSAALSACDRHSSDSSKLAEQDEKISAASVPNQATPTDQPQEGNKLADVAGQSMLPAESTEVTNNPAAPLPVNAMKYVGRYHVHVPCSDPVALCKESEGQIDYVLSLLADGTAYRKRVSLGRISIDERQNTKNYEPDRWAFDAQHKEIILTLFDGGKLYFKIIDANHLKANLDKIIHVENGQNRKNLGEQFILPQKARVLTKLP